MRAGLHSQKKRRQKEALERAVQEQRPLLIEEQNKNNNQDAFPLGNTSEGDLKHNATFQSLTNQKKSSISYNIVGVFVVHYLEMRKMTMRNMSWAALLIWMLICNGNCNEKRQGMQSVNLIRPILQIQHVLRQIFLNAIITRSSMRVTIY